MQEEEETSHTVHVYTRDSSSVAWPARCSFRRIAAAANLSFSSREDEGIALTVT